MQHQVDKEPGGSMTHTSDELSEEQLPEADGGREPTAQRVKTRLSHRQNKDLRLIFLWIMQHIATIYIVIVTHVLTIFNTSRIMSDDLLRSSSFSTV